MSKTALITGAAGNMGLAMVKKFLAEGYHVVGTKLPAEDISHFDNADDFECLDIDLMDEQGIQKAMDHLHKGKHDVEVAVLTVGGFGMGNLENTDGDTLTKMMNLNFYTAYYSARAVFMHMKDHGKGGSIFMVGAKPALNPSSGGPLVAYTLSKSLIPTLADILNAEGKEQGIVSTVLVPSIIDTPQNREAMSDADFDKWVKPEEIAEITHFVASEKGDALREPILKVYGDS